MKFSSSIVLSALTLAAGMASSAKADFYFTFTYNDTAGLIAGGNLTATDNGNGTMTCTSGTLWILSGGVPGAYPLFTGVGNFYSPGGNFLVNNLISPSNDPELDWYGILFRDPTSGLEWNIWNEHGTADQDTLYSHVGYEYRGLDNGVFELTQIPTPGAAALMGIGMLASSRRRRA